MFAAEEEVVRLLLRAGVGRWVTDELGRNMEIEDWAAQFVRSMAEDIDAELTNEAQCAGDIRDLLAEKPRKMIAVSAIREILDY